MSEPERLEAVKLAVALGNDVNAHADFGNYPMTGEPAYTLLYYPHNIDDLLELGVGDPRWSGSTPLIGAVVSDQPSIVQWLVDHGARVDDKTKLGWTPLLVAEGVFFANAKKEFPGRRDPPQGDDRPGPDREPVRLHEFSSTSCGTTVSGTSSGSPETLSSTSTKRSKTTGVSA